MSYHFLIDCVHSNGGAIQEMVDHAKQITWRTFIRHVPVDEVRELFSYYSYHREVYNAHGDLTCPFHIKDDWAVSYWKSKYEDKPCYFLVHSGIEYIFVEDK